MIFKTYSLLVLRHTMAVDLYALLLVSIISLLNNYFKN